VWRLTHQEDSRYGQLTFETYHTAVLAHEIQQDLLKTKRHALRVALTAQQPLSRLHRSDPPSGVILDACTYRAAPVTVMWVGENLHPASRSYSRRRGKGIVPN